MIIRQEPMSVYQSLSRDHLSSHALATFRRCPAEYRRQLDTPKADRPCFAQGRAVHTLVLEGLPAFDRDYITGGPVNPKTGQPYGQDSKAFAEWAAQQESAGKEPISRGTFDLAFRLASEVGKHAEASALLRQGEPEVVIRGDHFGRACQARLDWIDFENRRIVDLKTTATLEKFAKDLWNLDYIHQLAWYSAITCSSQGGAFDCYFIALETSEPYRVGVWWVPGDVIAWANEQNMGALCELERCEKSDTWPTGYEQIREVRFPRWMKNQTQEVFE